MPLTIAALYRPATTALGQWPEICVFSRTRLPCSHLDDCLGSLRRRNLTPRILPHDHHASAPSHYLRLSNPHRSSPPHDRAPSCPRFPCMGRLLSRATCSPHFLLSSCSLAGRRRFAPTPCRTTGPGPRTGQGRKPRSGCAQARDLTRSISSPPASRGINLVKPTNDPSGAMPRARAIAPQPCIRWVYP